WRGATRAGPTRSAASTPSSTSCRSASRRSGSSPSSALRSFRVERPQLLHLLGVGSVTVRTGNLEQRGQALELRVPEEDRHPLADQAVAGVVVPVAVRAERRLRVVRVQAAQSVEADVAVELLQHAVELGPVGDVVARRPEVARVEADAEALVVV